MPQEDLTSVFLNAAQVLTNPTIDQVSCLAKEFGFDILDLSIREVLNYNMSIVMQVATPYLQERNMSGYKDYCRDQLKSEFSAWFKEPLCNHPK